MRREEWVTVQGPVKEQQPDGMSHRGPGNRFLEGWIFRFSCVFAGWMRYCCWCIAVYFKFLAWKALHRTLYHAEHLVFRNVSQWLSRTLTHSLLVLLSISNVQTGEPIPVAPVEHVQLFEMKCSRRKKWHTEPAAQ